MRYLFLVTSFLTLAAFVPAANTAARAPVIKVAEKHLDLLVGDDLIGRYHIDPKLAKPHFHPLNGPFGKPVTRGWPMTNDDPTEAKDHPHQKAAWFCHGDVIPEGMELPRKVPGVTGVDFWAEHANHGWITCVEVGKPQSESNRAWITTKNEWQTPDKQKIMDESRVISLYDYPDAKLLVFDIDLHANVVPITFGDTKEGSFGVRVAETMTEKRKLDGVLENAEGKRTMKECWGYASAWCDYSGPVDGKTVGLTIFDDPKNPYPALWHSRDYGLMAANPFGRTKSGFPAAKGRTDLVKLAKGEHLKLRYGLLVHAGDAKEGKVAERYKEFVQLRVASSDKKPPQHILRVMTDKEAKALDRRLAIWMGPRTEEEQNLPMLVILRIESVSGAAPGHRLTLENRETKPEEVESNLRRFVSHGKEQRRMELLIEASRDVNWGIIADVLDAAAAARITRVLFKTDRTKAFVIENPPTEKVLPDTPAKTDPKVEEPILLEIAIKNDEKSHVFALDREPGKVLNLEQVLALIKKERMEKGPQLKVVFRCDPKVPYATVFGFVREVEKLGVGYVQAVTKREP